MHMLGIPEPYLVMLVAWVVVGAWIAFVIFANRHVHPKVLFFLFMVELWERFSYYGMRALLVLYLTSMTLTGGFNIPEKFAYGIYAAYGALVYLTPLAGGFLADRILGFRKSIIWGAVLMAAGQFTLASSWGDGILASRQAGVLGEGLSAVGGGSATTALGTVANGGGNELLLYLGLAMLVIGNGFFKPNISSLVGKFYGQGDPRRDGAFTIFYMGINIGAFLTPLTCGTIGELEGWGYGFLCAGIGMVVGLLIFLYTAAQGYLEHHADPPIDAEGRPLAGVMAGPMVYLGTILCLPIAAALIRWNDAMDYLLGTVGLAAVAYMLFLSFQYDKVERERIWVIIVLLFFTAVFWTFFELAGSALNIFTLRNVNKNIAGVEFTTTAFQSVNAFFIMVFAPVFAWMWVKLARSGLEPSAPVKFSIGLFLLGAGFLVLNLGSAVAVSAMVPAMFLILLYLLHTLGELALSPVGLSLVTKLAPARVVGFMMGFWFLSSAIAHQAGKWVAAATVVEAENATPEQTLNKALEVFNMVGLFAIGSGVLLLLLSPILKKWMHGIK
jgi:POT family proton-dependent oligopeptide transporter